MFKGHVILLVVDEDENVNEYENGGEWDTRDVRESLGPVRERLLDVEQGTRGYSTLNKGRVKDLSACTTTWKSRE
ncbi:hypothetical protein VNO77_35031 [Canavalia gladiata]|uniref:Uncharacterized protein n=1 Tax=Canavalia gladiata TaxID=3824 RepID=A0AAN9KG35_CANGL